MGELTFRFYPLKAGNTEALGAGFGIEVFD
jgi:hypothetical protein